MSFDGVNAFELKLEQIANNSHLKFQRLIKETKKILYRKPSISIDSLKYKLKWDKENGYSIIIVRKPIRNDANV